MAGGGIGGELVTAAGLAYRRAHRWYIGRSALCRLCQGMGRRFAAQDVHVSAESGLRVDPAGIRDLGRGAISPAWPANSGRSRRVDPVGRHRRRSAGRRAAEEFPHRSREQGPGLRRRAVALVASSELFLRMVRMAGLPRHCDLDRRSSSLSLGLGDVAGSDLHVLDPGACHRYPAARAADAALAGRALSRLPVAYQHVLSPATAKGSGHLSFVSRIIGGAERVPLPDVIIRAAIQRLCSRTATRLASGNAESDASFADEMAARAIAEHTEDANAQHYEVPAAFFAHVLGPNRKYSSCFYKEPESTLQEAEEEALRQTIEHADLADGQSILELGCGWGSLSLSMARQFPNSHIVAVSNSRSQRAYIESEAAARGLKNLRVMTADMNVFNPERQFDRIVSVEMFEHIMNWRELTARLRSWLAPDGRFFMHIFTHRSGAYLFDRADGEDWIAQHFFTGGVMPSHHLIRQYSDLFEVEKEWRWSGTHYQRTALDWLGNFDTHRDEIEAILRGVYGNDTALWMRRWRWFFLATAGLFGYAGGSEWAVSHFRMKAVG